MVELCSLTWRFEVPAVLVQMSDTGEWQVAGRRKGAARRLKTGQTPLPSGCCQDELNVEKTIKRIRETVAELRCEDFFKDWKEQLLAAASTSVSNPSEEKEDKNVSTNHPQMTRDDRISPWLECVCYGLGSFSSCVAARYQLAMMLLLLDAGQIPAKDCSVFDPVFSSGEKDVLRELGLTVLKENEEGKRPVTKPTLFYLMHCGKALYNNLLWKNWNIQYLPLMTVIGNSFSGIRDRTIEREFQRDYSYISQAVTVCEEKQLACPSRVIDVFSDTAVITFPACNLVKLPQSIWAEPPEPQYEHCPDLEIILRKTQS